MRTKYGFNTTKQRSLLMSKIGSKNTQPEIVLRRNLWRLGYRYRINVKNLPGKPDIVLNNQRLVIFIDGEFWHGHKWNEKRNRIKSNREYWIQKIEKNIKRDITNNKILEDNGWKVLRFWEHQIKKDIGRCVQLVIKVLQEKG